ncbi:uncharacterized protein LOC115624921 [Scaptodrosophila lebanonensis]|uniref:Uncharacterized protein LOC115624921 n=1 Tax=Drosophila lebanonensis TaxID=7225 RepID=A0A6J2TFX2_DROLE|nr:uncharacterized protein LOC115624921 [Scaptodrosophila lebanonensis]
MYSSKNHSNRWQWGLWIIGCLLAAATPNEARQIRINRYSASVQEDEAAVPATVREVQPTPYPAAGYRPAGRAFWLPGEADSAAAPEQSNVSGWQLAETTEQPLDVTSTTTDATLEWSTTTTDVTPEAEVETTTTSTEAPVLDSRAGRAYVRAPYPPAGFRPSRAFRLPTELDQSEAASGNDSVPATDNSKNPVCGVSTNPLKPTPEPQTGPEPDSESVLFTANVGPAVLVARAPNRIPVAIPLRSQRLIAAPPTRGFAYATHVEQRW